MNDPSVLGAGAALGVVTSLTFRTAPGDAVRTGGQFVVPCGDEGPSINDVLINVQTVDHLPTFGLALWLCSGLSDVGCGNSVNILHIRHCSTM